VTKSNGAGGSKASSIASSYSEGGAAWREMLKACAWRVVVNAMKPKVQAGHFIVAMARR